MVRVMRERDALDQYRAYLDELGEVSVGAISWDASRVLETMDPIAFRVGFNDWQSFEDVDVVSDDADLCEDREDCPACGEWPDYCQGHGVSGDPAGAAVLTAHDDGDHSGCAPLSQSV